MNGRATRVGAILVTVLLVTAVVWVFLAGLFLTVRLRHDVAVAALHAVRSRSVAMHVARLANAHDWWSIESEDGVLRNVADGICTWEVRRLDQSSTVTRYEVLASYGEAQVIVEGTALRR